jgi:hypothetical protein
MSETTPPLPGPNPLIYPVVMTTAGVLPTPPATLLAQLIQLVTYGTDPTGAQVMQPDPGYTAGLPGSLIEDISSTDTAACILMDQARVELINSMTPFGANAFLLNLLGQMFGIPAGQDTNMSVPVIFTGTVNFILQTGLQVSDGSYTYVLTQAGVVGSGGTSLPLTAVATVPGVWAIPENSVTEIVTSIPGAITLSVNNPTAGSGGTIQETEQEYRLRVLHAQLMTCQGTPDFIKTLLMAVPGVVAQQVGLQLVGGLMKVICGGSNPDPGQIAGAIYLGATDVGLLTGSTMTVESVTQANPGVVTTLLNHGYATGQVVSFATMGGMTALDTGTYTIIVLTETTFSIGYNTTSIGPYTGGGVVSPNLRNNAETINDYPDNYVIPWVTPPQQIVTVGLVWNAASAYESGTVLSQAAQGAIIAYINAIPVGAPINVLAMQEAVQAAVQNLLPLSQLSRMVWTIEINGIDISPESGTYLYAGDPESYFFTSTAYVTVVQG